MHEKGKLIDKVKNIVHKNQVIGHEILRILVQYYFVLLTRRWEDIRKIATDSYRSATLQEREQCLVFSKLSSTGPRW